jgi:membrane-bound lytic murein transglycosylase B
MTAGTMLTVRTTVVLCCLLAASLTAAQEPPPVAPLDAGRPSFEEWLVDVRAEAAARGISAALIEKALTGLEPASQILERDRTQTEFAFDLDGYLQRRLTQGTVQTAQRMLARHRTLAARVSAEYGVPSALLIAVWGLESNFGRFAGVRPTIQALATLAYDPRRGPMFRTELFNALEIVDRGDIALEELKGSWAGALGQPQFMPSSYLLYAQDFDGDGKRDIWRSQPDVFASIAYFLQQHGWTRGELWGREVKVPPAAQPALDEAPRRSEGCRAQRVLTEPRPLAEWRRLGLRTTANRPLPSADMTASVAQLGSRTFLVYRNYDALLAYNCSHNYALSVALLADRLR